MKKNLLTKGFIASTISLASIASLLFTPQIVVAKTKTGPNSSTDPYILPANKSTLISSILTVGDSVNAKGDGTPYRMVGIPDGLGAYDNGDGTFTLLMNHELAGTVGITRTHGATGAFVSKWIIRKNNLRVLHGEDLIREVVTWNLAGYYNPPTQAITFNRFCSADMQDYQAFFDTNTGLGYNSRLFMNGEESGAEGRAFAHTLGGTSYELPALGKFSWENSLAHPNAGTATVVVGLDDSTGGQIYIYSGTKTNAGNPVEMAGLTNGNLYGLKVLSYTVEDPLAGIPSAVPFALHNLGNVTALTGAQLEEQSNANGLTKFLRPEDGAWDPSNLNDFYFVTTASFTGRSRLWRLRFNNAADPAAGGTISMLLDGAEGPKMMDNITVDRRGYVFIQEDPGGQDYLAKIWRYNIKTRELVEFAQHDPNRFAPGAPNFLTIDEESSGIVDVSNILGDGWMLMTTQAHYNANDAELVEGGQLMAMRYRVPRNEDAPNEPAQESAVELSE